jgi:voltage-gated potassium channel
MLAVVAIIGTLWFLLIEHWSVLDSMYQTATTITTVGVGEVRPFDSSAKAFSIFLSIVGVSAGLFTLGAVFEEQLEETMARVGRRRMDRQIERLSGHTVLCGYGRVGARLAVLLGARSVPLVVIDVDERRTAAASDHGALVVTGSSTEDDVLMAAHVEHASVLIVSLGSDADAISTVLSARVLNPDLRIVARANEVSTEAKLVRAGCDHVVNPLSQGAQQMAAYADQPAVAHFLEFVHDTSIEFRLEEMALTNGSSLAGKSLGDAMLRARTGALVLAVRHSDGRFESNPPSGTLLQPGTTLVAIGTDEQLASLARLVSASS